VTIVEQRITAEPAAGELKVVVSQETRKNDAGRSGRGETQGYVRRQEKRTARGGLRPTEREEIERPLQSVAMVIAHSIALSCGFIRPSAVRPAGFLSPLRFSL